LEVKIMRISSYKFGRIVIDGVTYNSDCLILIKSQEHKS
jgi:hypothetical protein